MQVRRTAFAWFECGGGSERHREWCLLCLTNLGDCLVLSPDLRRQLNAAAVRKEDIKYGHDLILILTYRNLYITEERIFKDKLDTG